VGAATRDINEGDPRGWLLGGGVTYGALALARLGLHVGVILGLDAAARGAHEVERLREAGAEVVEVPLERGPVFLNDERPGGRVQTCGSPSDPIPASALPDGWRSACAWMLVPVASEIPGEWAAVPPDDAYVAVAWQGDLRRLVAGERVTRLAPGPTPLLARGDTVAVSRHDLPWDLDVATLATWLAPRSEVLFTAGTRGGLLLRFEDGRLRGGRRYRAIGSRGEVDATGAGDTMLAGVVAARVAAGRGAVGLGTDLRLGAGAASLLVEGPGIESVPTVAQLRERLGASDTDARDDDASGDDR
jgi:sugar/nucleoside kinase (ribokinase family)